MDGAALGKRLERVLDHAVGGELDARRERAALAAGGQLDVEAGLPRPRQQRLEVGERRLRGGVALVAAQRPEHLAHLIE